MKIYPQWADKYPNMEGDWMVINCNEFQFKSSEEAKNYFLTVYGGIITDEVVIANEEDVDYGFDPIKMVEEIQKQHNARNEPNPEPDFEV